MLKPSTDVRWGTDPEAFFQRNDQIIGSERLIPEGGLAAGIAGTIVRDGVQFELNPTSSVNLQALGGNISRMFRLLQEIIDAAPGISLCFNGLVEVSRDELDGLSPATRVLGCMPSYNLYGNKPIDVDPVNYRKRSSGGHIHMGLNSPIFTEIGEGADERRRLVPLLDIFLGNTAVLVDRDAGAAERRENYGRAGEYRLPRYGLEYRTPSNFWLRDFRLMSLAFGMADVAVSVLRTSLIERDLEQELVDVVNIENVIKAINTNDFDLALENFNVIRPFLTKYLPSTGFPLNPNSIDKFLEFVGLAQKGGIERYFPTETIVRNWNLPLESFESFLSRV